MRFIKSQELDGGLSHNLDPYIDYVRRNKDSFPPGVRDYLSLVSINDISSPRTLHDAWFRSLQVGESQFRDGDRKLSLELKILMPFADQAACIKYYGVRLYSAAASFNPLGKNRAHGWWMYDEIYQDVDRRLMSHEILFSYDARFYFEFEDMEITVKVERNTLEG